MQLAKTDKHRQQAAGQLHRRRRDGLRPLVQQGAYVVVLQHSIGPTGGGQCIDAHPVGQPKGATLLFAALLVFFFFFFFWAFLGVSLPGWAAGAACAELAEAVGLAGAPAVSAAQAGTAKINALNNSNIFLMVILPLWLKNIHGLPSFLTRPA